MEILMGFVSRKSKKPVTRNMRGALSVPLLVHGQGVLLFGHDNVQQPSIFSFMPPSDGSTRKKAKLTVQFTLSGVQVTQHTADGDKLLLDPNNTKGLITTPGAYYWFSLDSQNQVLVAGIGEARADTAVYRYELDKSEDTKLWLEEIDEIRWISNASETFLILRDPITRTVPLKVRGTDMLSMTDIALGSYMPSADLDQINQKLYGCISGKSFVLDDADFPDFSEAIEYSIATPSCWCYETLRSKTSQFGAPKETYLRITLNENNGESPGVPYVMEIWPPGHYSPIHNHGSANAVIRVLHGGIHVTLFDFLGGQTFSAADFYEGDVTWISPSLNQVHQLKNLSETSTCITIQCYMYDQNDTRHYDYFDYLDADGSRQKFDPDSDMDFIKFKETIRAEWNQR
jgi:predicted metal-dependent enzyme (double-stranded beta helix superfamily)